MGEAARTRYGKLADRIRAETAKIPDRGVTRTRSRRRSSRRSRLAAEAALRRGQATRRCASGSWPSCATAAWTSLSRGRSTGGSYFRPPRKLIACWNVERFENWIACGSGSGCTSCARCPCSCATRPGRRCPEPPRARRGRVERSPQIRRARGQVARTAIAWILALDLAAEQRAEVLVDVGDPAAAERVAVARGIARRAR